MKNVFWFAFEGCDPILQIESEHIPNIGDIIHYLCDGTEDNYAELVKEHGEFKLEFEGIVTEKWTSLSYKEVVWSVELKD